MPVFSCKIRNTITYNQLSIARRANQKAMAINQWPEDQRPRERLIKHGAQSLADAELLAVFLRTGVSGKSAVDLARDMVAHFGSLNKLFDARLGDFTAVHGLGPAKYAQLQAVLELARRSLQEELQSGEALGSPQAVREYLRLLLSHKPYESFAVLFLDVKNRLVMTEELFRGTLTHTSVYPREVVKAALAHNAAAVILAHNHPSGSPEPSQADGALTQVLKQALGLVDIRVLDHFIVAGQRMYSFAENGQL
jgi:DNA repair protein RadC